MTERHVLTIGAIAIFFVGENSLQSNNVAKVNWYTELNVLEEFIRARMREDYGKLMYIDKFCVK